MSIILARIDDRFIHGQVTVGWCPVLRPNRIVLCNDKIAGDPWQSRIYASSVGPQLDVRILSLERTRELLGFEGAAVKSPKTLLLVDSPADMLELRLSGLALTDVNVGGMHYIHGKKELLEYVYVDREDIAAFRGLLAAGTRLKVQSVPGAPDDRIDEALLDSAAELF